MDYAWFIYTVALMAVALAASSTSVTVWVLTNRKDCLAAAAGFFAYSLDVATILFDEYQGTKPLMEEYFNTGLTHPVANIILRVCVITCVWLWVAMRVHAPVRKRHLAIFAGVYAVVAVLTAPIGAHSDALHTMVFWGISDILILGSLVFAWWWRNNRASETDRISIDRSATLWRIALVLVVLILTSIGTSTTGLIIREPLVTWLPLVGFCIAIWMLSLFFAGNYSFWSLAGMGVAMLVMMVIPGHYLNHKYNVKK